MSQTESAGIRRATKAYQFLLRVTASLIPLGAIIYVAVYQDPALKFSSHGFHEIAIAIAVLLSGFATYVTWICYRSSGEVFLRWLTLGLAGFTILYAPHGALTRMSHENIVLFVIFGPISRLAMVSCFLIALLRYGAPAVPPARRDLPQFWLAGLALFTLAGVAATAGAIAAPVVTRRFMPVLESAALSVSLIALVVLASLRLRSPLMTVYAVAMAAFAQSSISFLVAAPWNHQWWLAHAIFAAGFFVMSWGIVQAFHTTRSFRHVYSQEKLMEELRAEKTRADEALAESRRTAAALYRSEHEMRLILESADEGIYAIDNRGICTLVNRSAARLTGYAPEEMLGADMHALIHAARPDGSSCPASECPLLVAAYSGETYKAVGEVYWKKDGTALHVDLAGAPIVSDGLVRGIVVSFTDLTARRSLETQLAEANRRGALGRLATSMAHEFNNVLMGMQPFTEILEREISGNAAGIQAVRRIASGVKRGKRVTEQIFQFTQRQQPSTASMDVGPWLDRVAAEARLTLDKPIELVVKKDAELAIRGDASQLEEVFLNLMQNAIESIESHGMVTLEVCRNIEGTRFPFGIVENVSSCAHFIVSDDGTGMSPQTMSLLFEPFFTTKGKTGLGLWFAHQVVTDHGGQIFVESEIGRGSRVHLFLPLAPSALGTPLTPALVPATGRSLVLVEDDEAVAAGLKALLELEGLHVTVADRGAIAVDTIARVLPDAVILDVGLPDINGVEVYARIAARWPDLPVLFSTGHAGLPELAPLLGKAQVRYLRKPYAADAILKWLDEVSGDGRSRAPRE